MLNKFLFVFLTLTSCLVYGQTYLPSDTGSEIKFSIKNFGISTVGTFKGLNGTIFFDPANLSLSVFDVSVESKTVDTDVEARDNHLRKKEYFDAENFPKLVFKSIKITKTNKPEYLYLFGNLTIKGITREVKFPFTFTPKDGGYLFEGEFEINRLDFGVGGKSVSLSDDLNVLLSVIAKKG